MLFARPPSAPISLIMQNKKFNIVNFMTRIWKITSITCKWCPSQTHCSRTRDQFWKWCSWCSWTAHWLNRDLFWHILIFISCSAHLFLAAVMQMSPWESEGDLCWWLGKTLGFLLGLTDYKVRCLRPNIPIELLASLILIFYLQKRTGARCSC